MVRLQRLVSLGIMLVLLTVFSGCAAWNISSRYDETVRLRQYKTFACMKRKNYSELSNIAEKALITKLYELGMKNDSLTPDVMISCEFLALTTTHTVPKTITSYSVPSIANANDFPDDINQRISYWEGGLTSTNTTDEHQNRIGKLLITITDNDSKKIIWQSKAIGQMPKSNNQITLDIEHCIGNIMHNYVTIREDIVQ